MNAQGRQNAAISFAAIAAAPVSEPAAELRLESIRAASPL
jgi:hypothetical protein